MLACKMWEKGYLFIGPVTYNSCVRYKLHESQKMLLIRFTPTLSQVYKYHSELVTMIDFICRVMLNSCDGHNPKPYTVYVL